MLTRLKTAIPLIMIVSLAFALPGWAGTVCFLLMSLGMLVGGIHEAFEMAPVFHTRQDEWLTTFFAIVLALMPLGGLWPLLVWETLAIAVYFLALCLLLFKRGVQKENLQALFFSLGIFLYLGWTLSFFSKIYFMLDGQGRMPLLFAIAVTKMGDVGAYIAGTLAAKRPGGTHKLAPTISPKKSWEGLAGGCIFSALTAFLLWKAGMLNRLLFNFAWWETILLGIGAGVIGLLGDLVESVLKRVAGKKDSGQIPGLGGILDVLDSLIPIAPLFYAILTLKKLFCSCL